MSVFLLDFGLGFCAWLAGTTSGPAVLTRKQQLP